MMQASAHRNPLALHDRLLNKALRGSPPVSACRPEANSIRSAVRMQPRQRVACTLRCAGHRLRRRIAVEPARVR